VSSGTAATAYSEGHTEPSSRSVLGPDRVGSAGLPLADNGAPPPRSGRPMSRAVAVLVGFYQRLHAGRPPRCRYIPSCSQYALEAVQRRGVLVAVALTARRLSRCHPWGGHGYDPVPERRRARRPLSNDAAGDVRTEG
jgi:uncharacterized protein